MSKYMQMKVHILPYYKKGFRETYPNVAKRLGLLDEALVEEGPSLLELLKRLDQLLYQLEEDPPFRELLLKHRGALFDLYEEVEGHIADWRLAKADQALYKIEDLFDEIEYEIGRM